MTEIVEDGNRYLPKTDWREQAFYETYKSQISLLVEAFKLLGWANGGGAVAMLTLMGALGDKLACNRAVLAVVAQYFAWGLVLCMAGLFIAYLTQMAFLKYLNEPEEKHWEWKHKVFFLLSTVATAASVGFFTWALIHGATSFAAKCAP